MSILEICPDRFQVCHEPRPGVEVQRLPSEILGLPSQVLLHRLLGARSYLGSRNQLGLQLLYQTLCCLGTSLFKILGCKAELAEVLGKVFFSVWGLRQFMAIMTAMGLPQVMVHNSAQCVIVVTCLTRFLCHSNGSMIQNWGCVCLCFSSVMVRSLSGSLQFCGAPASTFNYLIHSCRSFPSLISYLSQV